MWNVISTIYIIGLEKNVDQLNLFKIGNYTHLIAVKKCIF